MTFSLIFALIFWFKDVLKNSLKLYYENFMNEFSYCNIIQAKKSLYLYYSTSKYISQLLSMIMTLFCVYIPTPSKFWIYLLILFPILLIKQANKVVPLLNNKLEVNLDVENNQNISLSCLGILNKKFWHTW